MGAILQWSVGKHPQGIILGNSHDHGAYPWWRSAESLIPFEGVEQVVPYEYIWELLGFQKGAPE
jgi:hypothetical protein